MTTKAEEQAREMTDERITEMMMIHAGRCEHHDPHAAALLREGAQRLRRR